MSFKLHQHINRIFSETRLFFVLFSIWLVVGAILLALYSREELFFMVNSHHTPILDYIMVVLSAYGRGDCIAILLTLLLLIPKCRTRHYLFVSMATGLTITLVSYYAKQFYGCARPLVEYGMQRVHTVTWMDNAFNNSFPSGHTMGAFGLFLLLTFYLPARVKPWSVLFFFLALGCGYSRLYLGQHYFKDIYFGSIFGVFIAAFFYTLATNYITSKPAKK
jgi:membrane-associated phospholipid phosphatase